VINKLEIMMKNVDTAIIYFPDHHSARYSEKIKKNPGSRFCSPNENTVYNLTLYFTESYAKPFILVHSYFIIMAFSRWDIPVVLNKLQYGRYAVKMQRYGRYAVQINNMVDMQSKHNNMVDMQSKHNNMVDMQSKHNNMVDMQ
jgi:hypothetical protein